MKNFFIDGKLNFDSYRKSEDYHQYMVAEEFKYIENIDLSELDIKASDKVGLIKLNTRIVHSHTYTESLFEDTGSITVGELEKKSVTGFHETIHEVLASIMKKNISVQEEHNYMGVETGFNSFLNKILQSGNPYKSGSDLYKFEEQYESVSKAAKLNIINDYNNSQNDSKPQKYDANEKEQ